MLPTPKYKGEAIYYGWVIVLALAAVNVTSAGLMTVNVGLFLGPMAEEIGISQSLFGWSQTARLIGVALSGLVIGRVLDIYGTRRPLMAVAVIVFTVMLAMSRISNGIHLMIVFFFIGMIGMSASGGNLYAMVPISQWFIRKRGKAMSIVFIGLPTGIFIILPLTQILIERFGWRHTIAILGAIAATIIFLAALFIERRPEDHGMRPDGISSEIHIEDGEVDSDSKPLDQDDYSWTSSEAVRSFSFWKLTLANGLFFLVGSLISAFRIPYFISLGFDPLMVSYSISFEAVVSITISFLLAHLMRKSQIHHLMSVSALGMAAFFIISIFTKHTWHVFLAQAVIGFSIQSRLVFEGALWPNYYGKLNVGSIRGLVVPISMVFSFLGAPMAGMIHDMYGSYVPAWWISAMLMLISVFLLVSTPKPTPPVNLR